MKIDFSKAQQKLSEAKNIVITAHVNPDGDALGSMLAFGQYFKMAGKAVSLWVDDDLPSKYDFLPGFEQITRPAQMEEPADLLLVLDTAPDRIGLVCNFTDAPILNIDHHVSNTGQSEFALYLDAGKAATGEIVYSLLKAMGAAISTEIATCLYTAIATDCGFFRYSNTTPFTMEAAADLLRCGVRPHLISEALEKTPLAVVQGRAEALKTLELFLEDRLAIVMVEQQVLEKYTSTEGLIDAIRVIDHVDVAVVVKFVEDSLCRISMRSKFTDVSQIAVQFGGGGHPRAAGCSLKMNVQMAKKEILSAIISAMEGKLHG